jgi:hypothetical protein
VNSEPDAERCTRAQRVGSPAIAQFARITSGFRIEMVSSTVMSK